jgi:hypothetical protein
MSRGGRRPGAGAPTGNLNALKTGRYSKQFATIGRLFAQDPKLRATLLDIGERLEMKQQNATQSAVTLFARTMENARRQSRDGLNLQMPSHEWDSIRAVARQLSGGQFGNLPAEAFRPEKTQLSGRDNQKRRRNRKSQSDA